MEGHHLDPQLIQDTYAQFRAFFALDEAIKRKYDRAEGGARGYTPFGREHAKDTPHPDLKEFWHVGQEAQASKYRDFYPANLWPDELPELKPLAMRLYRSLEACATLLLQALAEYFELPKEIFASMIVDGNSVLRPIHYPPVTEGQNPNSVRAAAHEDINLITLLVESQGSGLEVLTRNGTWLAVDALEGDIVVDSGDMMSRITNGIVPATTHRVINPDPTQNISRYSMPFFIHPYADCSLAVMERFVSPDRPARTPPITAQEFLDQRLREIGLKS